MELQEMIERRAELRQRVADQRELVEEYEKEAKGNHYMSRQFYLDALDSERRCDKEKEILETMEDKLAELERETYRKGTAKYGTFDEAFDCAKFFGELNKMSNSIPFAQ